MIRRETGAVSAIEYTVCLAVVVASLLAMKIYLKRAGEGRLRQAADSIGEQFDPRHTTSTWTLISNSDTTSTSTMKKDVMVGGHKVDVMSSETKSTDTSGRSGSETVAAMGTNLWQ